MAKHKKKKKDKSAKGAKSDPKNKSKAKNKKSKPAAAKRGSSGGKKAMRPAAKAKSAPRAKAAAPARQKGVPAGFRTVTPSLVIEGASRAIEFFKNAFGAEELARMPSPDGTRVMHAEIRIGDSMLMLADDFPEMSGGRRRSAEYLGNTPATIHLYVTDADELYHRAVNAGCTVLFPIGDMFWGDRMGVVRDPFGNQWSIGTQREELTPEQVMKAAQEFFSNASAMNCSNAPAPVSQDEMSPQNF